LGPLELENMIAKVRPWSFRHVAQADHDIEGTFGIFFTQLQLGRVQVHRAHINGSELRHANADRIRADQVLYRGGDLGLRRRTRWMHDDKGCFVVNRRGATASARRGGNHDA
jgi:hypothetical protein